MYEQNIDVISVKMVKESSMPYKCDRETISCTSDIEKIMLCFIVDVDREVMAFCCLNSKK